MKTFISLAKMVNEFPKEWIKTRRMVLRYALDNCKTTL